RAEPVLVTGLSRTRWLASHLVVALAGGAVVMVAAGAAFGAAAAASTGDPELFGRITGASLVYLPALWLVAGLAVALYGWWPRAAGLVWLVPAYGFVVGYLGQLLSMPDWLANLSPFYSREQAEKLMLDVHHKGKAVVASGARERMEYHASQLHGHGLWATVDRS